MPRSKFDWVDLGHYPAGAGGKPLEDRLRGVPGDGPPAHEGRMPSEKGTRPLLSPSAHTQEAGIVSGAA